MKGPGLQAYANQPAQGLWMHKIRPRSRVIHKNTRCRVIQVHRNLGCPKRQYPLGPQIITAEIVKEFHQMCQGLNWRVLLVDHLGYNVIKGRVFCGECLRGGQQLLPSLRQNKSLIGAFKKCARKICIGS